VEKLTAECKIFKQKNEQFKTQTKQEIMEIVKNNAQLHKEISELKDYEGSEFKKRKYEKEVECQ
jgi:hypothetical protein